MRVLDHQPWAWFLLEEGEALYLDAHCSHGPFDYSVLIALSPAETAAYRKGGRGYLDQLAYDIHYSAPAARGSASPFTSRNLTACSSDEGRRATEAIRAWRSKPEG